MIGSEFSCHFFNQSQVKPKPIVARTYTFSRTSCWLRVITLSFDWFTRLSPSFLIGQSTVTTVTLNEGVVSKETVVLRRWRSSIQKFGFINRVDNVNWPPYRDSKS